MTQQELMAKIKGNNAQAKGIALPAQAMGYARRVFNQVRGEWQLRNDDAVLAQDLAPIFKKYKVVE